MAPIPAEIDSHAYAGTGLKGPEFTVFVHAIDDLRDRRKEIVVPPSEQIKFNGLAIHMPNVFVIEGVPPYIDTVLLGSITPYHAYQVREKTPVTNVFGVQLAFDILPQQIIVSRGKYQVKLQHDGLRNPLSQTNRVAILGLSLLPDELWPHVAKYGFSYGYLTGSFWDNPWNAEARSLSLPDPDGKLSWRNTGPQTLENFDPRSLYDEILKPKSRTGPAIKAYLETLKPVGLFFDSRKQG